MRSQERRHHTWRSCGSLPGMSQGGLEVIFVYYKCWRMLGTLR